MSEGKFLNSEQAKEENKVGELEQAQKEIVTLQARLKAMGELIAQYALQKADLELQLKEATRGQRTDGD